MNKWIYGLLAFVKEIFLFSILIVLQAFMTACFHLAQLSHSKRFPGFNPSCGHSVGTLHVLPLYALGAPWVLRLPPNAKNMHVRFFVSFISVWPCDGLANCPGCTLILTQWQLGYAGLLCVEWLVKRLYMCCRLCLCGITSCWYL